MYAGIYWSLCESLNKCAKRVGINKYIIYEILLSLLINSEDIRKIWQLPEFVQKALTTFWNFFLLWNNIFIFFYLLFISFIFRKRVCYGHRSYMNLAWEYCWSRLCVRWSLFRWCGERHPLIEQKAEQFWQVRTIIWVVSPMNLTKDKS